MKRIALLVPVFNEEKYVSKFVEKLFKQVAEDKLSLRIIFVDDGSTDRTLKILEKYRGKYEFSILKHSVNRGKGSAMKTGMENIKKDKFDGVIYMDGDCQHDPKYLKDFVSALSNTGLVFGYRDLRSNAPFIRKFGNRVARVIFRTIFNIKRRDILCGYMAIGKKYYDRIVWTSDDYGVEIEISAIVGKGNIPFKEIHIDTTYLDDKKGVTIFNAFFIMLKIPLWYLKY